MTATTGGTNNKVSKNFGAKSAAASAADPARVAGEGEGSPAPREVIVEGRPCLVTNVSQEADAWCAREVDLDLDSTDAQDPGPRRVVALDCEWSPPWYRGGAAERVAVVQLATSSSCLVLSVAAASVLPSRVAAVLQHGAVLKVGVNIGGDASRLERDFGTASAQLHDLATAAAAGCGKLSRGARSLAALAEAVLNVTDVDKAGGARMSDWGNWPLTPAQAVYAARDVCLCVDVYWKGPAALRVHSPPERRALAAAVTAAAEGAEANAAERERPGKKQKATPSEFYVMMRNKSIDPPNRGIKVHPQGGPKALEGKCFVVSGVLDSMSRDECAEYVKKHGGAMAKSITLKVTHVLTDHGEVGSSKRRQAVAKGIPIVSEDVMFDLVRASAH